MKKIFLMIFCLSNLMCLINAMEDKSSTEKNFLEKSSYNILQDFEGWSSTVMHVDIYGAQIGEKYAGKLKKYLREYINSVFDQFIISRKINPLNLYVELIQEMEGHSILDDKLTICPSFAWVYMKNCYDLLQKYPDINTSIQDRQINDAPTQEAKKCLIQRKELTQKFQLLCENAYQEYEVLKNKID